MQYARHGRDLKPKGRVEIDVGIRKTDGLEYVGYDFRGFSGQIRVSKKKLAAFKQRATEILRRNRGISMRTRLNEFRSFARGWLAYFGLAQVKTTFRDLDKWLRRRVRACYLKQWRKSKTRLKQLIKLGVSKRDALGAAKSGKQRTVASIQDGTGPCLLYTSPSPRDATLSRMPSSA